MDLLELQKKLLPDLLGSMIKRYQILHFLSLMAPIGRRNLSESMGMSERVLRSEVVFLKDQGLIYFTSSGMMLTNEGKSILFNLENVMKDLLGLKVLESELREKLCVNQIIIVPGNSDEESWVKRDLGRASFLFLKENIKDLKTVAVTGGSTMAMLAEMMNPDASMKDITFLPARGGLGEEVENQANMICATMARNTNSNYRLLHVPDRVSEELYHTLLSDPSIEKLVSEIKSSNIIIHGIGEAMNMVKRRGSSEAIVSKLFEHHAIGEACGCYFNNKGKIIHRERTIGLQIEDFKTDKLVITVAGGKSKGKAILSFTKIFPNSVLVIDEAAAKEIINSLT